MEVTLIVLDIHINVRKKMSSLEPRDSPKHAIFLSFSYKLSMPLTWY